MHLWTVGGAPATRRPFYDAVPLRSLMEPVFIQDDPTEACHFLYNHDDR